MELVDRVVSERGAIHARDTLLRELHALSPDFASDSRSSSEDGERGFDEESQEWAEEYRALERAALEKVQALNEALAQRRQLTSKLRGLEVAIAMSELSTDAASSDEGEHTLST